MIFIDFINVFTLWELPFPLNIIAPILFLLSLGFQSLFINKKIHKNIGIIIVLAITVLLSIIRFLSYIQLGKKAFAIVLLITILIYILLSTLLGMVFGRILLIIKNKNK